MPIEVTTRHSKDGKPIEYVIEGKKGDSKLQLFPLRRSASATLAIPTEQHHMLDAAIESQLAKLISTLAQCGPKAQKKVPNDLKDLRLRARCQQPPR
jgi:hypothetical protein